MKHLQASVRPALPLDRDISVFIDLNLWQEGPDESSAEEAPEEAPEEALEEALFEPGENQDLVPTVLNALTAAGMKQLQRAYRERLARSREQLQQSTTARGVVPLVTEGEEAAPVRITGVRLVEDEDDGWDPMAGTLFSPVVEDEKPVLKVTAREPHTQPPARSSWRMRVRRGWAWLWERLGRGVRGVGR